jgi:uncharacterized protein (TIGR02452 family)
MRAISDVKAKNVRIFDNTKDIVEELNIQGYSNTFKYTFDNISITPINGANKHGEISVFPEDTITTALLNDKGRVCILNMASPKTAGGGVLRGSVAQEECLFRCTNLYQTITQNLYPLKENEALYTSSAVIVKDKNYVPLESVRNIDCVTVAAVNLNRSLFVDKDENYVDIMKQKIRLMLSLPSHANCDTLVLGAWGCGVFDNEPSEVADMFYDILVEEKFRYRFNSVIFGVINDSNSVGNNFQIFNNRLNLLDGGSN